MANLIYASEYLALAQSCMKFYFEILVAFDIKVTFEIVGAFYILVTFDILGGGGQTLD